MQILIVSGFLGAGKTRFIKELVKRTGKFFAILENEFGALNIDSQTLKRPEVPGEALENKACESLRIWELTEGCICCSTNLDFNASVLTIANSLNPDYLIVEPSGVAMPSRIIQKLQNICYEQISLLAPICLVDGKNYAASKKEFPEYFDDQVWQSATVLLSKSEDFSPGEFEAIQDALKLPADVRFPKRHYSQWSDEDFYSLLETELVLDRAAGAEEVQQRFRSVKKAAALDLVSFAYSNTRVSSPEELMARLEILIRSAAGKVARAKGYVQVAKSSELLHFDLVSGRYSIAGIGEAADTAADVVVIGKNLQKNYLDMLWKS